MENLLDVHAEKNTSECPLCGGTGWMMIQIPGKASRAKQCECFLAQRANNILKLAGIPSRYQECTLKNFNPMPEGSKSDTHTVHREHFSLGDAHYFACRFVDEYRLGVDGLLFVGTAGVGKTHLAVGIIRELVQKWAAQCLFCDYRELLKKIQDSYNPSVEATELGILTPVLDTEVLVLDDLGAIRPSQWVWDTVSHVLNHRYNEKKTTIITTNFLDEPAAAPRDAPRDLTDKGQAEAAARRETLGDRITDRMLSRLHEMCMIIQIVGNDYRLKRRRRF